MKNQPNGRELPSEELESYRTRWIALQDMAERYWSDAALKARIDSGDVSETLSDLGITPPPGTEVRIVGQSSDTYYFVLPPDPNVDLSDEALESVAGGVTNPCMSTAMACSSVPASV